MGRSVADRRTLERAFAERVRSSLDALRAMERTAILGHAAAAGIPEQRALTLAAWLRRGEEQKEPPAAQRHVSWERFKEQAKADEESPWALKPYFPMGLLTIIAGEQKAGKTLWVSWAVGELLRAGKRVLFVQLDTARTVLKQRLEPFLPADCDGLAILFRDRDEVSTERGIERLLTSAREHGADVIIIDSLFRAMPGMDENDTNDIRQVTTNLERLGTESGANVAVLHHVRKAGADGRHDIVSADVRGGGGLLSSAAVVVLIQKRKAEGEGEVRFNVTCGDTWFEPFRPMNCCVTFGDEQPMRMVEDDGEHPAEAGRGKLRIHILRMLEDCRPKRMTTREVQRASRGLGGDRVIVDCLMDLCDSNQIEVIDGPNRSRLWCVRSTPQHPAAQVLRGGAAVLRSPLGEQHSARSTGECSSESAAPDEDDDDPSSRFW